MGRRWSDEQWKEFKFKVTLLVILAVVGLAVAAGGPGIEKFFLKPAMDKKTEPWAAKRVLQVCQVMEWTARRQRAFEIYETDFYFNWRGDESKLQGLKNFVEQKYAGEDDPEAWAYFVPWQIHPYLGKEEPPPAWVGGEGAKPHAVFPRGMLNLIEIYEDRRTYTPMRHILHALRHCFETGEFTQADVKIDLEDAIKRDAMRAY